VADIGCDAFVDEVSPGPDCGHLLVHIVVQDGFSVADAMSALRRDASRLRREVAMTITRKRAPELSFVPVFRKRLVFPPSTCVRRIVTMETWKRARCVCGVLSQRSDGLWS